MKYNHFRINDWIVMPELNQAAYGSDTVHLEPKIIDVLTYLAQHAGQLVSRDELMDNVWEGTIVQPDSLNRCISRIRSVFRERERGQVIETIRKRGYRLLAAVHFERDQADSTEPTYSLGSPENEFAVTTTMAYDFRFMYYQEGVAS